MPVGRPFPTTRQDTLRAWTEIFLALFPPDPSSVTSRADTCLGSHLSRCGEGALNSGGCLLPVNFRRRYAFFFGDDDVGLLRKPPRYHRCTPFLSVSASTIEYHTIPSTFPENRQHPWNSRGAGLRCLHPLAESFCRRQPACTPFAQTEFPFRAYHISFQTPGPSGDSPPIFSPRCCCDFFFGRGNGLLPG